MFYTRKYGNVWCYLASRSVLTRPEAEWTSHSSQRNKGIPVNQHCHDLVLDWCLNNIMSVALIYFGEMIKRLRGFNWITQWCKSKQQQQHVTQQHLVNLSLWLLDIKVTFPIRAFVLWQEPGFTSDRNMIITGSEDVNQTFKHHFIEMVDTRIIL